MAFISIFDVLGPEMIGPSSSHTAGACSIALLAGKMADSPITHVEFTLYQSFAKTHKGHGTEGCERASSHRRYTNQKYEEHI